MEKKPHSTIHFRDKNAEPLLTKLVKYSSDDSTDSNPAVKRNVAGETENPLCQNEASDSSTHAVGGTKLSLQTTCQYDAKLQESWGDSNLEDIDISKLKLSSQTRSSIQHHETLGDSSPGVIDLIKSKLWKIPELHQLVSDSSSSSSSSQEVPKDISLRTAHTQIPLTSPPLTSDHQIGFIYGQSETFLRFLTDISSSQCNQGYYTSNILSPKIVKGVCRYREGFEYTVCKKLHGHHDVFGVFLCIDNTTKKLFILKKISRQANLVGLKFLVGKDEVFLPKIYGVFKEKETFYIFQEYIHDPNGVCGSPDKVQWNIVQIRQFAEMVLRAFQFLHSHDLVHGDVKLDNLMMRNLPDPTSLVVIDFESAKHPQYPLFSGGYTWSYLPPWHEELLVLSSYDPLWKTADLWAIACVLICLVQPDVPSEQRGLWREGLAKIREVCKVCRQNICESCRKKCMTYIKENGRNILPIHLKHYMYMQSDCEDWCRLKQLLLYLTDTTDYRNKNVTTALDIIMGVTNG